MCVWKLHTNTINLLEYLVMMDVFSLEEEDSNELFITQSPKANEDVVEMENMSILGDGFDFTSPMVSIGSDGRMNSVGDPYEDISDEDFEIPPSQKSEGHHW